jgi:hypothetical protein
MALVNAENYGANPGARDNRAALQSAIDDCVETRRVLYLRSIYRVAGPLMLPNIGEGSELVITGDSEFSCGIQAENDSFPIFTNASGTAPQDLARLTLRKLKLRDGSYAIRFVRSGGAFQSLLNCESVRFETQGSGAIRCDQFFLLNNFTNCVFYYCVNGIYSGKHANLLTLHACRFEGLDGYSLFLDAGPGERGCESAHLLGCRIEARNAPGMTGGVVFRLRNPRVFTVEQCYIENTFRRILEETGSNNSTSFLRNWFSGQENDVPPNGWKSEEFTSDGVVVFDTNEFLQGSRGAARMEVRGNGNGLIR